MAKSSIPSSRVREDFAMVAYHLGVPMRPAVRSRALALAAALVAAAAPAGGQEGAPDADLAVARAAAATRVAAHGDWCRDHSCRGMAGNHYEVAIRLDPGNDAAAEGLKSLRDPGNTKAPGKPAPPSPRAKPAAPPGPEAIGEAEESAYRAAASGLAEVAAARETAGDADGAKAVWREVLSLDPSHARAREVLGFGRAESGWLRLDAEGPRAVGTRFAALADQGKARMPPPAESEEHRNWSAGESEYGESAEPRFRAKSYDPDLKARGLLEDMLRTEALFEGIGLLAGRGEGARPLSFLHLGSEDAYEDLLQQAPGRDDAWRKEHRAYAGFWWDQRTYVHYGRDPERSRDHCAHTATHFLLVLAPPWLSEGAAHLACSIVRGRALTVCVSPKVSAFKRNLADLGHWDDEARDLIRRGDDPPLSGLIGAGTNDLTVPALIKCRSIAAWLLSTSPGVYKRIAGSIAHAPSPEDLFLRVLGAPPEAVDRRWRLWALRP